MYKTYTYPLERTYKNVWDLVNPENDLLLGLGGITSWPIESLPPAADSTNLTVPEIFIYIPVTRRKLAQQVNSKSEYSLSNNGFIFDIISVENIDQIRLNNIKHACLEIDVDHNLLPQTEFRSLGLFRDVTYTGITDEESSYDPAYIDASLFYLENFQPITVTENTTQTFKIIVEG